MLVLVEVGETGTFRKRVDLRSPHAYPYAGLTDVGVDRNTNALTFTQDPQEFYLFPLSPEEEWKTLLAAVADGVSGPSPRTQSAGLTPVRGASVTTWNELRDFVLANYKVETQDENGLSMRFDIGNGRQQIVLINCYRIQDGSEWLAIESPIGDVSAIDVRRALDFLSGKVAGGLVTMGSVLILRHTAPMASLDVDSFRVPLEFITVGADQLEAQLLGHDRA